MPKAPVAEDPLLAALNAMRADMEKMRAENEEFRKQVKESAVAPLTAERMAELQAEISDKVDKQVDQNHIKKVAALPKEMVKIVWPAGLQGPVTLQGVQVGPYKAGEMVDVPIWVVDVLNNHDKDEADAQARMKMLQSNPCVGNY